MSQDRIAELERENERLKQVCNCDLSKSAGVTIAGGRHSCGRIFVGSRVKELEAEVARLMGDLSMVYQEKLVVIRENLRLSEQLGSAVKALNGLVAFTKSIDIFIGSYQGVVFDIESVKASRNQALVVAQDCLTSLSKGQP